MSENDNTKNTDSASLLVIVFDTNPNQSYVKKQPNLLTTALNSIIALGNSHLMLKSNNKLAVIACHHHKSEFLYPNPKKSLDIRQIDGQYEYFLLVEKTIKTNLSNLIMSAPPQNQGSESLLAGSLAMVLCYIARVSKSN
jgi:transcription initiation factor TFIIH subunit 3